MKRPAHIKVAEKEGPQAGLDTLHEYLARNTREGTSGLENNRTMLKAMRRAGGYRKTDGTFSKPEKAVAWYCNYFNKKFGTKALLTKGASGSTRQVRRANSQADEATTSSTNVNVTALVQAAIQAGADAEQLAAIVNAATGSSHEVEDGYIQVDGDDDADDDDGDTEIEAEATPRRVQRQAAAPTTEYPGPRDPDADATNGKLWTLNTEGPDFGYFLVVVDSDMNLVAGGDAPLKNGECHELIAEIRAA